MTDPLLGRRRVRPGASPRHQYWASYEGVPMATITCVESTMALSHLTGTVSPTVRTPDQLTFVVEYGEAFQVALDMHALYQPLREALTRLTGWSAAVATRAGWHHLTAYLDWAGSAAWTAAIRGQTERFALHEVALEVPPNPAGPWLLGAADFRGTWSASLGVDLVVLSGTTAVTLDGTPGLPGFIAPAVTIVGEAQVPLHGLARGSIWLVVFGRNNPSPYTVNGRPLYVHLNGLAI